MAILLIIVGLPVIFTAAMLLSHLVYRIYSFPHPRVITNFDDLKRHVYINEREKTIEIREDSEFYHSTSINHPDFQCLFVGKTGDQFRLRRSKGLFFILGPEPLTGPPVIKNDELVCDVGVIAESGTDFTFQGSCAWLTGRFRRPPGY